MIDPHVVLNSFQKLQERNVGIDNYNAKLTHLSALMPEGIWSSTTVPKEMRAIPNKTSNINSISEDWWLKGFYNSVSSLWVSLG